MKTVLILLICTIIGYNILSHRKDAKNHSAQHELHNIFIQLYADSDLLKQITTTSDKVLNRILKQENILSEQPLFLPKERQRLTLYTVNDLIYPQGLDLTGTIVDHFFDTYQTQLKTVELKLDSGVKLFGAQGDELVIGIKDDTNQLTKFNAYLKAQMHAANTNYRTKNANNLYDILKSERFSYSPHMGLGRLRTGLIKQALSDQTQANITLERVKQKLINELTLEINKILATQDNSIKFASFGITDATKHLYLNEQSLAC